MTAAELDECLEICFPSDKKSGKHDNQKDATTKQCGLPDSIPVLDRREMAELRGDDGTPISVYAHDVQNIQGGPPKNHWTSQVVPHDMVEQLIPTKAKKSKKSAKSTKSKTSKAATKTKTKAKATKKAAKQR